MNNLILILVIIFTILCINLLNINDLYTQIVLFLLLLIFFNLFYNVFRKMIKYNKNNNYSTTPITNSAILNNSNANVLLNNSNAANVLLNNNAANVLLNNNAANKVSKYYLDFVCKPNNVSENNKYYDMKTRNLKLISSHVPIPKNNNRINYNILHNTKNYDIKIPKLNNIRNTVDCAHDDGSCVL